MNRDSPQRDDRHLSLDRWVAMHGPVSSDVAIVLAIDTCARASRMSGGELRDAIGSLSAMHILRGTAGRWEWMPVRAESRAHGVGDTEVIERLGALLFQCITGHALFNPFADERAIRSRLANLRPDLTPGIADLTVRALSARRLRTRTLDAFARDASQVLGTADQLERPRARRTVMVVGTAVVAFALVAALWWMRARSSELIESNGLTARETALSDVTEETAQGLAMMDEHTAAIQEYEQLARWLTPRLAPEDPRLAWNSAHEGWVRTLRGDRLTTEQILGFGTGAVARLETELGDRHPYTRAVRLDLAATMAARGATAEAASLRGTADKLTGALVGDTSSVLANIPAPPGVVAHLSANAPEREGFRRANGGAFFVPLTSIQRLFAGRDGWRLHLTAGGTCRASVVVGTIPRLIAVSVSRAADSTWHLRIEGTAPPLTLVRPASETVRVSLIGDGGGLVDARVGDHETHSTAVDMAAPPPAPPYSLAFEDSPPAGGCAVVWLEIPFPFEPKS